MENYIGIDWGEKKVGVAFADGESKIAFALETLLSSDSLLEELSERARTHEVDTFVVGRSSHDVHDDNVHAIETFGTKLVAHSGKAVVYTEEMFSTSQAHANLKAAGHKNVAQKDDAEAARIILQHYLDHM